MEQISNHYVSYQEFKQAFDVEMTRMAVGFVRIGFLLKYGENTNIVAEGGYSSMEEFVKAEYEIDASQISRFGRIYERFGVPGEPRLQDQYMNHGVAKLGIMLTLPDFLNEEITEGYSKSEINTLKHEYEAEQKITDLEVMLEKKDQVQQSLPDELQKEVYQLIHDYPSEYKYMYKSYDVDDLKEALTPNGECAYNIRIAGKGRLSIFMKPENIVVISLRTGEEREEYSWQQLFDAIQEHIAMGHSAKESWENCFNEEWPLEEKKPATPSKDNVQQSKPAPRKESKVKVPVPKAKKEEPKPESAKEPEEQLPGQDSILNHPEYLPDDIKEDKPEVLTGEVEEIVPEGKIDGSVITVPELTNPDEDNVQQATEGMKVEHFAPVQNNDTANTIRGYKAGIRAALTIMEDKYEQGDWSSIYVKASDIAFRAKKIMELEGKK